MTADARRILTAQGLRAFAYGFGSVLLGVTLASRSWSTLQVGVLLTAVVAGTALASVVVGTYADRLGRRRCYAALFLGLAVAGAAFALSDDLWLLILVSLTGVLSTEVVESGPFTSLEQAILPSGHDQQATTRTFGFYNAVATLAGSAGALAAGGPTILRSAWTGAPADERFFLVFLPVGLAGAGLAWSLSSSVEVRLSRTTKRSLDRNRSAVVRLASLFAVDSFGGGFVIQSFIAYWFRLKFHMSVEALGLLFFAVGMLQTASFLAAPRVAERIGPLNTMVFTHLPSNVLLACIAFAPNLPMAIALLLTRQALSQMDVPTRQAFIAMLVDPEERTAAVAYTNTARYAVRPLGPLLASAGEQLALGLPFLLGGGIKAAYDILLWLQFRSVPLVQKGDLTAPADERTLR